MSTISRRLPNSNITRQRALSNFSDALTALPGGSVTLPPDITTDLPGLLLNYSVDYQSVDNHEGNTTNAIAAKNLAVAKLKLVVLDFLKVVRLAINRSVVLGDGDFRPNDGTFYNLDSTGGDLPLLNTDDEVEEWANSIIGGEANRLSQYPGSPAMTNPGVGLISTLLGAYQVAKGASIAADNALTLARQKLNNQNATVDTFIRRAWDFLEANYSQMDPPTRRNLLRNFGVVFVTQGEPNVITLVVKDQQDTPLEGAKAVLVETGAESTTNPEGRANISTNANGPLSVELSYPSLPKQIATLTIGEDVQGQTFDLGEIRL